MTTTTTTTAAGTTVGQNPNWIRAIVSSVLLALLLREGFRIPFMNTIVAIGIIYTMQVVKHELGGGVATTWLGIKYAGSTLVGVIFFIALRFIAAEVTGIYFVDSYYNEPDGIVGMFTGRDVSNVLLFELMFSILAGGLAAFWTKKAILVILVLIFLSTFVVLGIANMYPGYFNSWGTRAQFDEKLVEKGGFKGVAIDAVKGSLPSFSKPAAGTTATVPTAPVATEATKVLQPMSECHTPCSLNLDFTFDLETQGDPIVLQFPGIDEPVHYSGKGAIVVPDSRDVGMVKITSMDPNRTVWVRARKVIMVR